MPPATLKTPKMQARAEFRPGSYDPEKHTIDVCFSQGAGVMRMNWWTGEKYIEELVCDEKSVRMGRLNNGASVCDTHDTWSVRTTLGVVERGWFEGDGCMATLRFSQRPDVAPIERDVADGITRNISVGYIPHVYEKIESADNKVPTYRCVDWEPTEISFVPVPADFGAQVRGQQQEFFDVEIRSAALAAPTTAPSGLQEETTMPNSAVRGGNATAPQDGQAPAAPAPEVRQAPAAPAPAAPTADDSQRAVADERTRAAGILQAVRKAKLGEDFAERLIADGVSLDQARAQIIDAWAGQDQVRTVSAHGDVRVNRDETDTRRSAMADALLLRYDARYKLRGDEAENRRAAEAARAYRGLSLLEMARTCIEASGGNTRGMSKSDLAGAALNLTRAGEMSTSDFPKITADVTNKTLRQSYEAAPQTWRPITREVSAADFKTLYRIALSEAPRLAEVKEGEEITRGKFTEAQETYAMKTYAKIVAITRKTIINDDVDAFTRVPMLYGRAAADLESETVWKLITANAAMADAITLFHASHNNLGTAAAINISPLGEARKLLRKQKAVAAKQILNLQPTFLIVPAALETVAQQYLNQTQLLASQASSVNPFAGSMQLIVEARLDDDSATAWYMAADTSQIDILECAYLEGQAGVYIETKEGFEIDGIEIKARLDFGAGVVDYRGLVKNAGA